MMNKQQKQKKYDKNKKIADKIVDKLGKGIDAGIKDLCIILNTLDFNTSASCEGHIGEKNNASFAPWVDVPFVKRKIHDEYRKKRRKELDIINAKEAKGVKTDRKTYAKLHKMDYAMAAIIARGVVKFEEYLREFYKKRKTDFDLVIKMREFGSGIRLEPMGSFLQMGRNEAEKRKKLKLYQQEFKDFESFLKKKYFK